MNVFPHWQQVKVLLVDDNEMGRLVLRAMLENVGIQVVDAQNGVEAVSKVKKEAFDLVLMDIQMPGMDGLDAARTIRKLDLTERNNMPIIAMSANIFAEQQAKSLTAGMNSSIAKPIELETLYAVLRRWLPAEKQQRPSEVSAVENAEYSDLESALPGVDVKAGIRYAVGSRQTYLELLKRFVEQFSAMETELDEELAAGQQKEAIRRAHTLKGVAGGLGATQLQHLTGQLEGQLTREKNPAVLAEVFQELGRLLIAIKTLPDMDDQESLQNKLPGTVTELREIFKQLLEPLKNLQAQVAKQQLTRLKEKDWPEEYRDQVLQLEKLIEQYQFNPAVKLLETILSSSSPSGEDSCRSNEGDGES